VIAQVLVAAGFEAQEFIDLIADPQVKAQLISNTDEAVARGAFGAPTMFVGDHLFFGQDRLDFVRHALA
jgi:2-hydroxychromene-2-carboxylate isomerase